MAANLHHRCSELMMSFWPFSDRRACPRWRVAMNIIYGVGDDMTATTTVELSEQAVSIFVRNPYPVGKTIDVHLAVDGNERWIKLKAKVTRAGGGIMAMQFLNIGKRDIEDLGEHLRALQSVGKSELISAS
jgi:PilZ domain